MSTTELLQRLKEARIKLSVKDGKLSVNAPKGALTPDLRDRLKASRDELIELLSAGGVASAADTAPLPVADRNAPLPLSFAQQRFWFLEEFEGGSSVYNIPWAARLRGSLQPEALQGALEDLAARHESLRTTFRNTDDGPIQVIQDDCAIVIERISLPGAGDSELRTRVEELATTHFNLATGPLMRVALIEAGRDDWVLCFVMHHIIIDGWSLDVLQNELFAFYSARCSGKPLQLDPLRLQMADYASWQRSRDGTATIDAQLDYWKEQLRGAPPVIELPTDRPRPAEQSYAGAKVRRQLPGALSRELKEMAGDRNVTLFMLLMAAFQVLLARHSGQDDIVVGTPVAGRQRSELEGLIGLLLNTLAIRGDVAGDPGFSRFLEQIAERSLDAFANQDLPFDRIVDKLGTERNLSHTPVFQVQFVLQNTAGGSESAHGLRFAPLDFDYGTSKFDLTLAVAETPQGIATEAEYSTALFDAETVERLLAHFEVLLTGIVATPDLPVSRLPLLEAGERRHLLTSLNDTAVGYPREATLQTLLEQQAAATPDAVALICEEQQLSYAELNARANQLAHWLRERGIGVDDMVGVYMERSVEMVVALLGIVKAGGAYVPLDPEYPEQRLQHMLEDAGMTLILSQTHLADSLPAGDVTLLTVDDTPELQEQKPDNPVPLAGPENIAYVIFTSGSTGRPKGVMNEHRGICNRLLWMQEEYGLGPDDRVLQKTPFSFDVSVWEFFWPLLSGAALVVARPGGHKDSDYLCELIRAQRITTLHFVPSMLQVFLQNPEAKSCISLQRVICSGEALSHDLQTRFYLTLDAGLHNLYGPTEAAIDVTYWACRRDSRENTVPIGYPVANTHIYIVEPNGEPAPQGVAGELWIGGVQVARGYANRPDLTAERFIPDPFAADGEARVYRTGDLARFRNDGAIEFLGRIDHQVKLRGFRIELGEIEASLDALPEVEQSLVLLREDVPDNKQLVAYVTGTGGVRPDVPKLRDALKTQLPEYMVPAAFVTLDEYPLLPNGKVDRKALPEPEGTRDVGNEYVPPGSAVEKTLARIWSDLLRVDRVGIHDNFFELGGDSILSIQIITRAGSEGIHLQPKQVFRYQTIAELAAVAGATGRASAEQGAVTGAAPLTPVQQWFFSTTPIDPQHFNQSLRLQFNSRISLAELTTALRALAQHHDALRLAFNLHNDSWQQRFADERPDNLLAAIDVSGQDTADAEKAIIDAAGELQSGIALDSGCLLRALLIEHGDDQRQELIIAIHHLAVDGVSWRILLEDLQTACEAIRAGHSITLPAKTSSFRDWARALENYSQDEALIDERTWWLDRVWPADTGVPVDRAGGDNTMASLASTTVSLDAELTRRLLQDAPRAYRTQINDLLLSALARAWQRWSGLDNLLVDLEGHGREDKFPDLDVSRTVGWFTSIYPVCIRATGGEDKGTTIKRTKEQLRAIPDKGFGYGVLRYLSTPALTEVPRAQVMFNYLGQFDQAFSDDALLTAADGGRGYEQSPQRERTHLLDINGSVFDGQLNLAINYSHNLHDEDTIAELASCFREELTALIEHCSTGTSLGYTPSDFPLVAVSQSALDELLAANPDAEDIYPVTPMQHGMLFHSLIAGDDVAQSGQVYVTQVVWDLEGELDKSCFERAWQNVADRHAVLRTSFHTEVGDTPLAVVHERAPIRIETGDWQDLSEKARAEQLDALLNRDRERGYQLEHAPLMRLYLFDCGNQQYKFVWSHHHIIIDGWSIPVLLNELFATYDALSKATTPVLEPARAYRSYIDWLHHQDRGKAEHYWRDTLAGFDAPTPLPGAQHVFRGVQEEHDFDRYFATLSAEETRALRELARRLRLTLNTLAQGLWSLMLSRYTGDEQVLFGATTSGRPADLKNVESIIGLFLNTVPVYTRVDPRQTAGDWLASVQEDQLSARQYEYASLTDIQGWSDVPRGSPLFHSLMIFENYPDASALWEDRNAVRIRDMQSVGWTNFPLSAAVSVGGQLVLRLSYDLGYYTPAAAAQVGETYLGLLRALLARPDATVAELLEVSPPARADRQPDVRPTQEFEFFATGGADGSIPQRFAKIVAACPDAIAVRTVAGNWSYQELDARANTVAQALLAAGVTPGDRAGLLLNHDAPMLAGLLGALKAGATYIPLDPDAPELRLRAIARDADLSAIISVEEHAGRAADLAAQNNSPCSVVIVNPDDGLQVPAPQVSIEPDSLAYILFTSGSTGVPKGVMQTHRNTLHQVATYSNALHLAQQDRLALFSPYGFDAAIQDIFGALLTGASVSPVSLKTAETPDEIVARIRELGITVFHATPTVYRYLFAQHDERMSDIRIVVLGGEEARPDDLQLFRERFARGSVFVNGLGLTESTMTLQFFADHDTPIPANGLPAGQPVSGLEVRLLDDAGKPAAISGEICIRSPYLTPGYWNAPELTAERFSRDSDGVPLFRTGDHARIDIDGNLIFTGRLDTQLKVRGNRIEAGEVEAALRSHPDVSSSAVLLMPDDNDEPRLTAYVTGNGREPDGDALRAHLRERLPDYMVPAAFIAVAAIPLLPNGKLDRAALPRPGARLAGMGTVAPRTATEQALADIWKDILGIPVCGVTDDFFALGGHSLIATQLMARVRDALGCELPLRALFDEPTIAGLARLIDGGTTAVAVPQLVPVPEAEWPAAIPLSFSQQRLWFLDQLEPGSTVYTLTWATRLQGQLNPEALARAFNKLAERHAILRTHFADTGDGPVQVIAAQAAVPMHRHIMEGAADERVNRKLADLFTEPFDLATGPLLRVHLVETATDDHVLMVMIHHIISDAWSNKVLMQELSALYAAECTGNAANLPPLPAQYADYSIWQRNWLQGDELDRQVGYWKERLSGATFALDLPTDRPRPPVQTFAGDVAGWQISPTAAAGLNRLAQENGCTLYMVLIAAYGILLGRHSNQDDLLIGTPIAGRRQTELEKLIGFFVNTLVMRSNFGDNPSFSDFLQRVRRETLDAFAHQEIPFEKLVEELQPDRDQSRSPLFQTAFILQNTPVPWSPFTGITSLDLNVEHHNTKFDLTLVMWETSDAGLYGYFEYNTDLFDRRTVDALISRFNTLLDGIVAQPDLPVNALPLLNAAERHELLTVRNATEQGYPDASTLHGLFAASAAGNPDKTAVETSDGKLTYRDIDVLSNRLAHRLQSMGSAPDKPVALCTDRTADLVVGVLGILKSGSAYVPLDPAYPDDRIAYMLEDCGADVLVTVTELEAQLPTEGLTVLCADNLGAPEGADRAAPTNPGLTDRHLAYIIYTSGSTGKPKGVQIEHRSAVNFLAAMTAKPGFGPNDRLLAVTTLCFDISVLELLLPLACGGTILIATRDEAGDGDKLQALLERDITMLQATPATWRLLLQSGWEGNDRLQALCGGEALERELANQLHSRCAAVWNMYGPTEATVWTSCHRYNPDDTWVSVGKPIGNTRYYVLDQQQQPVPEGVAGELYIGGDGVARGYRDRPQLTAEKFLPDPFAESADARMYRTGDLARYLPSHDLQVLGRTDFQVKLRGFRIELGEIENALQQHPDIAQAVVVLREDSPGDQRLVGYFTAADEPDHGELRSLLQRDLPDYMVPAAFMHLDVLPLTPNGKVDRKALPVPEYVATSAYVAPRTPMEETLCAIWAEILGVEQIGIDDHFFMLGGHSLLATRLIARVRAQVSANVELRALFNHPTVREFAGSLDPTAQTALPPIEPISTDNGLPLSFAQQRLWFLDQMEPGNPVYNIPLSLILRGTLNKAALQTAVSAVCERHSVLRTTFVEEGTEPLQRISDSIDSRIDGIDVSSESEPAILARLTELAGCSFDLAAGPLIRVTLLEQSADTHYLSLVVHHTVADGWSLNVFFSELLEVYAAECEQREATLADLPVQYADYAAWQRSWLSGDELQRQTDYWREQLRGAPELIELPLDYPRPSLQTFNGALHFVECTAATRDALHQLANDQGSTLYMVLLSALNVLLARHTGQDDIVIGTPIAGRQQAELEDLIGFFVNTLALRTQIAGNPSYTELLGQVRETALDAFEHQQLPFEKLVEELQPTRNMSHSPIFQVLFNLHNEPWEAHSFAGLDADAVRSDKVTAKFDLSVNVDEYGDGLRIALEYNTDLFAASSIERLGQHFGTLLEAIVAAPQTPVYDLEMIPGPELRQLTEDWSGTSAEFATPATLHGLFEASAAAAPDAIAARCDGKSVTYRTLEQRANQLAHELRARGAGPDIPVALCCDRSIDMLIGVLGILKSGSPYVPLDPSYPADRIAYMLDDSAAAVMVTTTDLQEIAGRDVTALCIDELGEPAAGCDKPPVVDDLTPEHLAYIIYTSGSTGKPKGVQIEHRHATNFVACMTDQPGFRKGGSLLAVTTLCFDISVLEMFLPLWRQGTVVVATRDQAADGYQLRTLLNDVDVMQATPATWRLLLQSGWEANRGLTALVGGEALERELAEKIDARVDAVWNMYGPTEATVWASVKQFSPDDPVITVGRPLPNYTYYILDERLRPVPLGVNGELYIGGASVARGYRDRPELTAERFITDPFSDTAGARLYRTGDLARYLDDGEVQVLGRTDFQVKLRGFRIELGEIEAALTAMPGVSQAVVVLREDAPGDKRLVAYLTGRCELDDSELRSSLKNELPDYMVPSAYMRIDVLPLTPNGKIDRKALPAPEYEAAVYVAPRNDLEAGLCELWADVLGADQVGINDDFFVLGGHSLLGTQLIARIRDRFDYAPRLRDLFIAPTVAEFALTLDTAAPAPGEQAAIVPLDHSDGAPLSFAQQRLWFLDQMEPGNPVYNIPLAVELRGKLDQAALQRAVNTVVARHAVLRTRFTEQGTRPVQLIATEQQTPISHSDVSGMEETEIVSELSRLTALPFDLAAGPLLRVHVLEKSADLNYLSIVIHHVAADGWSLNLFFSELLEVYAAASQQRQADLPELAVQYADYAAWQREELSGEELERQLGFWRQQLAGAPELTELPTDYPRPALQTFNGAVYSRLCSTGTTQAINRLAGDQGSTLFMVLLAALNVLLARHTGQNDVVIGTPVAGRRHSEVEQLIGVFINTLALRTQLEDKPSFTRLLKQVRDTALDAFEHQDVPFEKLVEELQPARNLSHSPIFQVLFNLHNEPWDSREFSGLEARSIREENVSAKFDLSVNADEYTGQLRISFEYNTDLFSAATISRLSDRFMLLLEEIVKAPDASVFDLPLLTDSEYTQVTRDWNTTTQDFDTPATLHGLFEQAAADVPDTVAVRCDGEELTYRELDNRSNQLAHRLQALGAGPDVPVALCTERSTDMLVGVLGILKSGAAYVPLDPTYPVERVAYMLNDCGAEVLVTQRSLLRELDNQGGATLCIDELDPADDTTMQPPECAAGRDNLAYVIYTSGSTGKPKGVQIEHGNATNFIAAMVESPGFRAGGNLLAVTTLCFDISILELFLPLWQRGTVVVATREQAADGYQLQSLLANGIDVMQATPATWRVLLTSGWEGTEGLTALCGGEALERDLAERIDTRTAELWNMYGPTEATVWASVKQFSAADTIITVGRPLPNYTYYILDEQLQPVPPGVNGELFIGGVSVARGYRDRPDLTAERFISDPFSDSASARLYRTGDLARFRDNGEVQILGRTDFQVKLRGFRIELGEIESALAGLDGVTQAIVVLREDVPGDKRLVAYLTGSGIPAPTELRATLKSELPDYMVPSAYVQLDELPLTPNGKVDRKALPAPEIDAREAYTAPRSDTETTLCRLWGETLRIEQVGIHDDFFVLGGHSLLGTQLIARIRDELGGNPQLRDLFTAPTVAEFTLTLGTAPETTVMSVPLAAVPHESGAPLSFAQQRLWFLDQMEPGNPVYNIPLSVHLRGELDVDALQAAVDTITSRHEVLRTRFTEVNAEPVQTIDPDARIHIDRYTLDTHDQDAVADRIADIAALPFSLEDGPLWRVALGEAAKDEHYLTIVLHHTISDGWSINIFLSELLELYSAARDGREAELNTLPVQYADYAIWQRKWLEGPELERQTAFWRERMEGAPALLELPTDRPRPAVQTYNGDFHSLETSAATAAGLRDVASREGCTLYMVMLAATNVLLGRHAGQDDIVIGTPVAGRKHTELEGLIGFFINTLALRNDLSGNPSFSELLQRVRGTTLDAFEHQEMPFEKLVEELQLARNLSHTPVFQVMFNLHNQPWDAHEFTGIEARGIKTRRTTSKFDLSVHVDEQGEGLRISFEYNTDLFDRNTISTLMQRFHRLLDGIAAAPEQTIAELPLGVTSPQPQPGPAVDPADSLAGLFEAQVVATPDAPAVRRGAATVTYGELNQQANVVAYALNDVGQATGRRTGLLLEHDECMIAGVLGALKAGTAYVPLDPYSPPERSSRIAENAGITALVCAPATVELARQIAPGVPLVTIDDDDESPVLVNPAVAACAGDLAYILFTSGSTGMPKGVMQTHGHVISHVRSYAESCGMQPDDRVSLFSTYGFDASIQDIFGALLSGACIYPLDLRNEETPDGTLGEVCRHAINVLHMTPTVFRHLFAELCDGTGLEAVRAVILGGEETRREDLGIFRRVFPEALFINGFGMTESTMVLQHRMSPTDRLTTRTVPVGLPVPGNVVTLRDRRGAESALCGEICIRSNRLTTGYWQDEQQTAASLLPVAGSPDERILLTGDQARRLADGSLVFSGREDDQVKIRGHRIELQEIALTVETLDIVAKCAVLVDDPGTSGERLLAYVKLIDGNETDVADIRAALREKLPPYMLPSSIMILSDMPLTRSGKIDRKALPAFILQRDDEVSYAPPITATQIAIAGIWSELLDIENPGIHDDFFALGGHSLLTIRMLREIEQRSGRRLTIASVFEGPTIERISALLDSGQQADAPATGVIMPIKTSGNRPPLFCIDGEPTRMAGHVHEDQPIYSIYHAYDGDFVAPEKIEDLAGIYIEQMRKIQPHGPYHLAGFCVGGLVGYEMSNQLRADGEEVAYLAMIDPTIPGWRSGNRAEWVRRSFAETASRWRTLLFFARRAFASLYARTGYTQRLARGWLYRQLGIELPLRLRHIQNAGRIRDSHSHYRYRDTDQDAQVFLVDLGEDDFRINEEFWQAVFTHGADVRTIEGLYHHAEFLTEPFISNITRIIDARLGELNSGDDND